MIRAIATNNRRVLIELGDNGCGVSAQNLKKVFDPFFTTKMGRGKGLGLNVVNNLVEGVLGGSIKVESIVGAGTLFVIDLPMS